MKEVDEQKENQSSRQGDGEANAAKKKAREHSPSTELLGFFRGEMCPFCKRAYPMHNADCESKPTYCEACEQHTTHCAKGHCQECYIDDEHFPIEDCGACAYLVGCILRVTVEGSEVLPTPEEIHDLTPNPFED